MDSCALFTLVVFGLFLLAVVGHAIWIVLAAVFHALFDLPREADTARSDPSPTPARQTCIRCGTNFARRAERCPSCGLLANGPEATELRELEIATRQIQQLVQKQALEAETGEHIYQLLEARQTELLKGTSLPGPTAPTPVPADQPLPVTAEPLRQQLERLLTDCPNVFDLSAARRQQALGWLQQLREDELAQLSPGALLILARLLRLTRRVAQAIEVYRLLIRTYQQQPEARQAAIEAARFAVAESLPEHARWFLGWALELTTEEQERHKLLAQLSSLPPSEVAGGEWRVAGKDTESSSLPATRHSPPATQSPRRSLGGLLAGFMEERNILWGELVGGLLIVGCSIALVISLWQTLEQIPYFPFLIFATITAALFAAGHYTLGHWNLEATSRGLLVIATLLTPLDFLVVAGLERGRDLGGAGLLIELAALVLFTLLVWRGGRVLVGTALPSLGVGPAAWLTLAVMGSCACQLLAPQWPGQPQLLGFLPSCCHALALGAVLLPLSRRLRLDSGAANALFLFLGQAVFAVAAALGFLVYCGDDALAALRHLAMPVTLAGLPILVAGAMVHRLLEEPSHGTAGEEAATRGLSPEVARLVGTVTTLAGVLILLAAPALAWPEALGLIVVGAVNATLFTVVALRYHLPPLHVPALACLAIASLTAFHVLAGNLPLASAEPGRRWLALAASPASGSLLTVLAVALSWSAERLLRRRLRLDALYHAGASGLAAVFAMLLVSLAGTEEPGRAALVFGTCGTLGLLVNLRWLLPRLTFAGSIVLLIATWFGLGWLDPDLVGPRLLLLSLLIQATLLLALSLLLHRSAPISDQARDVFLVPFRLTGLVFSVLALPVLTAALEWSWLLGCCLCLLWLGGLWLAVSWVERWPGLFQAFQAALAAAVLLAVSAWLRGQPWVEEDPARLLRPHSLQVYALGLALLSLAWACLRRATHARPQLQAFLEPGWRTVAGFVLAFLVIGQLLLALAAILPDIVREHALAAAREGANLPGGFDPALAWWLLTLLGLVLAVDLWGNRPHESVLGGLLLGLTVCLLPAFAFRQERAASALRWGLALGFLTCSALLWLRRPLARKCAALGIGWPATEDIPGWARRMLLLGAVFPVLVLTGWAAVLAYSGDLPAATASMVAPLLLLALALIGHGYREDSAGYIFAAGHLLTITLMGGYSLAVVASGGVIEGARLGLLLQLGVLGVSLWGVAWLALVRRRRTPWNMGSPDLSGAARYEQAGKVWGRWRHLGLLGLQALLGWLGCLALGLAALFLVLGRPVLGVPQEGVAFLLQAGSLAGWLGLGLILILGLWLSRLEGSGWRAIHVLGLAGFLLGILVSCTAARWDAIGWLAFHTLALAWALVGLALLTGGWSRLLPPVPTRRWVEAFAALVVLLALAGALMASAQTLQACAAILAMSVLLGADAVWSRRPVLVYLSGLLLNLAAYLLWRGRFGAPIAHLAYLQILALAVGSACWSLLELRLRRLKDPIDLRGRWLPFVHAAALMAVQLLALVILTGIAGDLTGAEVRVAGWHGWLAFGATLAALLLCFWDPEANYWGLPVGTTYLLGLLGLLLLLHGLALTPGELIRSATLLLSVYLTAAAVVAWLAPRGAWLRHRLRIPERVRTGRDAWFVVHQALLGALVLGASFWLCLDTPTPMHRLTGPVALLFLTLTSMILTECWPTHLRQPSQEQGRQTTLALAVLAVLQLSWALLGPERQALWLHRNVQLLAALAFFGVVYRSGLTGQVSPENAWAIGARRQGSVLALLALAALVVVLVQEFLLYNPATRRVPLGWPEAALVGGLLGVGLVGGLAAALARSNPFALGDKGKVGCVWFAEGFLVLLLVHLRLNVPDLLPQSLGRYWPVVLMVLGYAGIGLAELFQRRGLPMLAKPLQQTGLFLPLLPLLAFLLRPLTRPDAPAGLRFLEDVIPGLQPLFRYLDNLPAGFGMHALLWFLLGGLYALVAILRRSSGYALLAALAANFGLWVVCGSVAGLGFLLHPQLWLIPLGLILLWAESLNRDRLTEGQSQGVRYLGLLLIYLSSTADLFITGLGNSVLLPVVLAVLAIAGVLAGILVRVRAFLLTGVAFLFLVVFSQIWHAAVDRAQTWVWWTSGIVLGVSILLLFALFEKRRNDVLRVIEELKGWR